MPRPLLPLLIAALVPPASALAQDRIPSHCIALAERIPDMQVIPIGFGDALAPDHVRLTYVSHATFLIETAGGLVAATDFTGYLGGFAVRPDVVTMNNAHGTHWTAAPDAEIPHVLRGWGDATGPAQHRLDLGEMLVRKVPTDVRSNFGAQVRPGGNSIFVFEAAGLCIGHLGHLHQVPSPEQYATIGRLDVVMVPVDGGYSMSTDAMAEVVDRLRSSLVIPMHWFSGTSLDLFLAEMAGRFDIVRPEQSSIELTLGDLPSRPTIMVLTPAW